MAAPTSTAGTITATALHHYQGLNFLRDAAELVAALREEGQEVLVHCVAAQSRTPAVGIAYAMLRGVEHDTATKGVCSALPGASPNQGFRDALVAYRVPHPTGSRNSQRPRCEAGFTDV